MKPFKHGVLTAAVSLSLVLAFAGSALAQEPARLQLQTAPDGTGLLADGEGFTLYAFSGEEDGAIACTADCTDTWLPLLTDGRAVGGAGIIPGLIGSVDREEGTQVTFMNRPLYRYAGDEEAGSFLGQGAEDSWYAITQTGSVHTAALEAAEAPDNAATPEAFDLDETVMLAGQQAYGNFCAMCHGVDGSGGGGGPSLRDRDILAGTPYVASQILFGGSEMPSFKDALDDSQIAEIATYVRNSFGNSHGPVTSAEVAEER